MKTSLCTGGAGFLGSHLATSLLQLGHKVVVLDDLSGGLEENVPQGVIFVKGSILNVKLLEKLFAEHKFNYVYHLAAYAAEGLSHFIKRFNYQNNLIGSVNLINASVNHGVECFIFTSSIAVYGAAQAPMREDMWPQPEDSYGIAKFAVEQELRASHQMFGLEHIIFRPHNVFGPRQNIADKYRNVVGIFMNQLLKGEPMTIFGDGEQQRAFSYVDDIIPIMARAVDKPEARQQVFNIGADQVVTVNQLSAIIAHEMGVGPLRMYLKPRKEVKVAFSDHAKVKSFFGEGPSTPLWEGIRQMAAWVKTHGAKPSKPFAEIEIQKNMPESWLT